jgi:hypothetical protein
MLQDEAGVQLPPDPPGAEISTYDPVVEYGA